VSNPVIGILALVFLTALRVRLHHWNFEGYRQIYGWTLRK